MRALMRTEESEALSVADAAINAMAAHNTMPDLIFSPNEHYLNSLIQKMVESDKGMATDDGGATPRDGRRAWRTRRSRSR